MHTLAVVFNHVERLPERGRNVGETLIVANGGKYLERSHGKKDNESLPIQYLG